MIKWQTQIPHSAVEYLLNIQTETPLVFYSRKIIRYHNRHRGINRRFEIIARKKIVMSEIKKYSQNTKHVCLISNRWNATATMLTSALCLLQQDLFAFEILGGLLYLHADLGSGSVKIQASKARIDDGVWHDVALRRVERDGRVTVDSSTVEFRTPGKEFRRLLQRNRSIWLKKIPKDTSSLHGQCDVEISRAINPRTFAFSPWRRGSLERARCRPMPIAWSIYAYVAIFQTELSRRLYSLRRAGR